MSAPPCLPPCVLNRTSAPTAAVRRRHCRPMRAATGGRHAPEQPRIQPDTWRNATTSNAVTPAVLLRQRGYQCEPSTPLPIFTTQRMHAHQTRSNPTVRVAPTVAPNLWLQSQRLRRREWPKREWPKRKWPKREWPHATWPTGRCRPRSSCGKLPCCMLHCHKQSNAARHTQHAMLHCHVRTAEDRVRPSTPLRGGGPLSSPLS